MRGAVGGTASCIGTLLRGDGVVDCQSSSSEVVDSSADDSRLASCGSSRETCVDGDLHARVIGRQPSGGTLHEERKFREESSEGTWEDDGIEERNRGGDRFL